VSNFIRAIEFQQAAIKVEKNFENLMKFKRQLEGFKQSKDYRHQQAKLKKYY